MDIRYSCNQRDFKRYATEETRKEFLIEKVFDNAYNALYPVFPEMTKLSNL